MKALLLFLFTTAAFANSVTVSGISSGAYMAQQFHTAYSETVSGVGIVAGGPYYCAQNSAFLALNSCMSVAAGAPRAQSSLVVSRQLAAYGLIDPIENISS